MASLTRSQLKTSSDSTYDTNGVGGITAAEVRTFNDDLIDSLITNDLTGGMSVANATNALTASSINGQTLTSLNQYTASNDTKWSTLGGITGSFVTETESGSFLVTASVNLNTITFTKGNNSTFAITVNTGSAATTDITALNQFTASQLTINTAIEASTSSLNTFSASTLTRLTNIESTTASLLIETQNLETFSASALVSINALNSQTASYVTETESGSFLITASVNLNTITFTKGNNTTFAVTVNTGSGTATDLTSLNQFTASQYVSNSFFATTGSNSFNGSQIITGSMTSSLDIRVAGVKIGFGNPVGSSNIAIGTATLLNNTGNANIAIGTQAMQQNTSGGSNLAMGLDALQQNTTGQQNVALGEGAFRDNRTGIQNTIVGHNAGLNAGNISGNTLIGQGAGRGIKNGNNTIVGQTAALNITSGSGNTIIGQAAGVDVGIGNFNIFIGQNAGRKVSGSANTFIGGYQGIGNESSVIALSDGSANIRAIYNNNWVFTGSVDIQNTLTASLQQGFTYVGNASGRTIAVSTSSFASTIDTGSFATTASFNSYTASTNGRLTNIQSTTASLLIETQNLELFSASALVSISNLNTTTASLLVETQNLELFSASALVSINALNSQTSSYVTETESGSFLLTASFDNGTRNLTFTKGNNTSFAVNIPDVSGSGGNFVTTSSFNAYTQSNDQRVSSLETNSASVNISISNINTTTASLLVETQNLELFSASALVSISNLNASSASQQVSINNLNTATASLFLSASLAIVTASVNNDDITFTKGDGSQFTIQVSTGSFAVSSSYAETASLAINAKDIIVDVKNTTGAQINKGTVVRIIGATGDNPLIGTASWTNDANSANTLGFVTENIANDAFGRVMTQGSLLGVNTDPALGYTAGQLVYLSSSGQFTNVKPPAPFHEVRLGQVLRAQQNNGSIYVLVQNGYELDELHDVDINTGSLANNNLLAWNSTTQQWENKTVTEVGATTTASFNAYTQSTDNRLTNIESTTASLNSSISQLNASSASQQISIDALNTATASLFTSASLSLTTASFSGNTLTFSKGDGSTFGIVIPDVSGSTIDTGSFAITGSNTFRGDQTISGSVNIINFANGEVDTLKLLPYLSSSIFNGNRDTILTARQNVTRDGINYELAPTSPVNIILGPTNAAVSASSLVSGSNNIITNGTNFNTNAANIEANNSYISIFPSTRIPAYAPVRFNNSNVNALVTGINNTNGLSASFAAGFAGYSAFAGGTALSVNTSGIFANVTANPNSSSVTLSNSVNAGTLTITGNKINPNISQSVFSIVNTLNLGTTTLIDLASGSYSSGNTSFIRNLYGGVVTVTNVSASITNANLQNTIIFGSTLIVTGSDGPVAANGGSAFFGRYNVNDGITNRTSNTVFAVGAGTGTGASAKTPLWVGVDASVNVTGSLLISGTAFLNGVALGAGGGGNFATTGSNTFNGNQTITGSVSIKGNTTFTSVGNNTTNIILGANALGSATSANNSVAIGENALFSTTTGNNNFALGNQAMYANTTGYQNVAMGVGALYNNTTGFLNVAIGNDAMISCGTASFQNVAIGSNALKTAIGNNNFGLGANALENNTGNANIALGQEAGRFHSGSSNVLVGQRAGQYLTGSANTIIGGFQSTAGTILDNNIIFADGVGNARARYSGSAWSFTGGINFESGSNKTTGLVTADATGTTVSNSLVTANSMIFLTPQALDSGGNPVDRFTVYDKTTGSFKVKTDNGAATTQFAYLIINPTT